jgi:hypothetical protein
LFEVITHVDGRVAQFWIRHRNRKLSCLGKMVR